MRRLILLFIPFAAWAQVNVLTANYGNERTSANVNETVLTTANVGPGTFGKIASVPVDAQIYAQPLYVNGVNLPASGARNVVYVATMNNSVYAIDGDTGPAGESRSKIQVLWQVNLGTPVPSSVIDIDFIQPQVGILSTPVIDIPQNVIYLIAEIYQSGQPQFWLHALDLSDGHEKLNGPVQITATVPGDGDGTQNGMLFLDPMQHLQRPGLLLLNGIIYAGFGSTFDRFPFHGWILAYDASDLQHQLTVLNITPHGGSGGIWQAGRGLAADAAGNIYAASGNGDNDGVTNFGEAFMRLSPSLQVLDWFAPADWHALSNVDYDLGSEGPVLVPNTTLLIGGDKANNMYLVDRQDMGHLGVAGAAEPQIFPAVTGNGIFNIALWNSDQGPIAYLVADGDHTLAYQIVGGQFAEQPFSSTGINSDYPFQGIAISANGGAAGTGILWMTAGDHSTPGVPGTLLAFDAMNLNNLLWTSGMTARDNLGAFAKFATPTIANGRVYVPTFSNALAIYGLLPPIPPQKRH
jgi:outer membrane protein assembly factor BamB